MELASGGVPVMAIGGVRGTDPTPGGAGGRSAWVAANSRPSTVGGETVYTR